MREYIAALKEAFEEHSNAEIAAQQKAYMRNQFEFIGLKTQTRRAASRPFLVKEYLPVKSVMTKIVVELWNEDSRDYHHFAQELYLKYVKQIEKRDIEMFGYMIANQSWWDTVDFIAPKLVGAYFKKFPEERDKIIKHWLASDNIWLQRSCVIFQLKYKHELDTIFLDYVINQLLGSKEFFINKAIGWMLREYGKTNAAWVVDFAYRTELHSLSRREALRIIYS
ncbi:MAG: DNA alkylation repair protein [Flavobacteriales bacterium]|nr:DNA alkylation repair protein [Flavobacteriales bacterium]